MLLYNIFVLALLISVNFEDVKGTVDGMGKFPQLLSDLKYCRYLSVKTGYKRNRFGKVKEIRVDNQMDCSRYCSKMADSCVAVNVETKSANGLHLCEIYDKKSINEERDLSTNAFFNYISLEEAIFSSCADIYKNNAKESGTYSIRPTPSRPITAYCDMVTDGGGWTVIQKRFDGSVNFYRNSSDYKEGFGNKLGEYWLGLDMIYIMTSQEAYELRIDMVDFDGYMYNAKYDSFKVNNEADGYRVRIGSHKGYTFDAMKIQNGMKFSTYDKDNDADRGSCARNFKGGWWYNECFHCNLNGLYGDIVINTSDLSTLQYISWAKEFKSSIYTFVALKEVEMKIRPIKF